MMKKIILVMMVVALGVLYADAEFLTYSCYRNGIFQKDASPSLVTVTTVDTQVIIQQEDFYSNNTVLKLSLITTNSTASGDHLHFYAYNKAVLSNGVATQDYLLDSDTTTYVIAAAGWTRNIPVHGVLENLKIKVIGQYVVKQALVFTICKYASVGLNAKKTIIWENEDIASQATITHNHAKAYRLYTSYQCDITKTAGSYGTFSADLYSSLDSYAAYLERATFAADGQYVFNIKEYSYPSRLKITSNDSGLTAHATCIYYEVNQVWNQHLK